MRVPAHVHFEAWGGGYPIQWVEELIGAAVQSVK